MIDKETGKRKIEDVKDVVRKNIKSLYEEEIEMEEKLDELKKGRDLLIASRNKFKEFCEHEALYDEKFENLVAYGKYKPSEIENTRQEYLHYIEKEEFEYDKKIEKLQTKLEKFREDVKNYNTRERLTEALNNPKSIRTSRERNGK